MDPETGRWLDSLEDGRRLILQELRQIPPQARAWRPGDGVWSSLEVAHHLVLTESLTVRGLLRGPRNANPRRGPREWLGRLAVRAVFRLGLRVRIPTERVRPDPEYGLGQVETAWDEARDGLLRHYRDLPEDRVEEVALVHPIAGPLDHRGTLEFLAGHQVHHLAQLRRLRRADGFPWNP